MTETADSNDAASAATPTAPSGSPTLNPRSRSCILPVAVLALLVVIAYIGFLRIVANTGTWAIEAGKNGLVAAGLPADRRAPFEAEVGRLEAAFAADTAESQQVVNGVALLLDTAMVPLLVLDDVRDRRVQASGLEAEERDNATAVLGRLARLVDARAMDQEPLIEVLGELSEVPEDGSPVTLTDDAIRALVVRAEERIAKMEEDRAVDETQVKYRVNADLPTEAEVTPTHSVLLTRYREHVDAVLAGTASKVDR